MLYVNWNTNNNNHVYSKSNSKNIEIETDMNKQEAEIIYNELINVLAKHIINNQAKIEKLLEKHKIKYNKEQQQLATIVAKLLYKGNKQFRDDLVSSIIISSKQIEKNRKNDDNPLVLNVISGGTAGIAEIVNKGDNIKQEQEKTETKLLGKITEIKQQNLLEKKQIKKTKTVIMVIIAILIIAALLLLRIKYKRKKLKINN